MLNVTNHQENENQNHNEILPCTCEKSYCPKKQVNTCWQGCGKFGTLVLKWEIWHSHYRGFSKKLKIA
jgi:hypothetical protein